MSSAPRTIRFATLPEQSPLQAWQQACLDKLSAVADVERVALHRELLPAQVRALDLDFILSWSQVEHPVELLEVARFGVWRYQYGDWLRFRGGPPGFWEVHEGKAVSTAMLVRLLPDSNSVVVLRSGSVQTQLHSSRGNRRRLQQFSFWPAQLCVDIHNGVLDRFERPALRSTAPPRAEPSLQTRALHGGRILFRIGAIIARSLFRHEQWNIGVVDRPIQSFLDAAQVPRTRWFPQPGPEEIRADPFGIVRDGALTVFCEYLHFRTNRGVIVAIDPPIAGSGGSQSRQQHRAQLQEQLEGELQARLQSPAPAWTDTPVQIGPVPAVHLSYPYLLELDGRLLCVPESHQAGEIALYELARFPDRWEKIATLVSRCAMVDATPFRHNGSWWLAASDNAGKEASCELHLWFADDLTGPWHPHPGNPVKIDVRSARPAGTPFVHDGQLFRPAQDCSTTYGARTIINHVVTLTRTAFEEEFAVAVTPDPEGPYPAGLHTLSAVGARTLVDGKRIRFVPAQFWRNLGFWLRLPFGARD